MKNTSSHQSSIDDVKLYNTKNNEVYNHGLGKDFFDMKHKMILLVDREQGFRYNLAEVELDTVPFVGDGNMSVMVGGHREQHRPVGGHNWVVLQETAGSNLTNTAHNIMMKNNDCLYISIITAN